jgi:hypothetical protein
MQAPSKSNTGRPLQVGEPQANSHGFARRALSSRCMSLCAGYRRRTTKFALHAEPLQSTTSRLLAPNVRVERQIADGAAGGKLSARTRGWAPGSGSQHDLPTTHHLPLGFARTLLAMRSPGNHTFAGLTHALATPAGSLARHHRPSVARGPVNTTSGGCPEGTGEPLK